MYPPRKWQMLSQVGMTLDARMKQAPCAFYIIFPDTPIQRLLTLLPIHVSLKLILLSVK